MKYGRKSKSAKSFGWDEGRERESILHYFGYIKDKKKKERKKKHFLPSKWFQMKCVTKCITSSCPPCSFTVRSPLTFIGTVQISVLRSFFWYYNTNIYIPRYDLLLLFTGKFFLVSKEENCFFLPFALIS